MVKILSIHPQNPQAYLLAQAVTILKSGGVIVYPTDSGYALGCQLGNREALERIRQIRQLDKLHYFTLMCRDLSDLANYAQVDKSTFRILKAYLPGPYTFILKASRSVPKRILGAGRKTLGMRIPRHAIAQALLDALELPLMSSTLVLPETELALIEPEAIKELLGNKVDLLIDGGFCGIEPTSVVDLSEGEIRVLRKGKGDVSSLLGESK